MDLELGDLFYAIISSILCITGLILNVGHIVYVLQKDQRIKNVRIGTVSISVSNIVASVFGIIPMLSLLLTSEGIGKTTTNATVCKFTGFAVFATSISMIIHVAVFSFLSCISITHPFLYRRYARIKKLKIGIISGIYFMSMFWPAMVIAAGIGYTNDLDDLRCSLNWRHEKMPIFLVFCLIFIVLIPASVTIASTVYGCRKLQQQINEVHRATFEKMFYLAYSKALLIAWLVSWAPYTISVVVICCGYIPAPAMITVSACFAKISVNVNPIVYFITARNARKVNFFEENETNSQENQTNPQGNQTNSIELHTIDSCTTERKNETVSTATM